MSDSVWPHRQQPTRLPRPWDSPGKNTGVGCNFLLQCMKVKSESEVIQSWPSLRHPMDCSLPGSSVHEIFQARVLEWVAIAFSKDVLLSRKKKSWKKAAYFMILFILYSGKCKCEARGNPEKAMHAMNKESVLLISEIIPLTKNRSITCWPNE